MHLSRTLTQAFKLSFLLVSSSAQPAHANGNREDLCGVSVHTADFPDVGGFSIIDGTFTVPKVADLLPDAPYIFNGVALCCGDDCSTRIEAGVRAWLPSPTDMIDYTAEFVFRVAPTFNTVTFPQAHRLDLNSSDTFRSRIQVKSPSLAQVIFWKSTSPTSNLTVEADLAISTETSNGQPLLSITTRGYGVGEEKLFQLPSTLKDADEPALCGDSAWWYLSDGAKPQEDGSPPGRLSRFSPVLVGGHGLQTTNKRSFPADLPLSGMARLWNMVRDNGFETVELCNAKGFVDTGMTMLHAPHAWGV